jgi:hypothetical protein
MAIPIPGRHSLFSLLQEVLHHQSEGRICLSRAVHDTLDDFRWLATDLASRPTCMHKIFPQPNPELASAQDLACLGIWEALSFQPPHVYKNEPQLLVALPNHLPGGPFCGGHTV